MFTATDPDLEMECPTCGAAPGVPCDHDGSEFLSYTDGGPENCVECGEPNEQGQHDRCCSIGLDHCNAAIDLQIGE